MYYIFSSELLNMKKLSTAEIILRHYRFLKWVGLTSFSLEKTKHISKRSFKVHKKTQIKNLFFWAILCYIALDLTDCHHQQIMVGAILLKTTQLLYSLYACLLFAILNLKQTKISQICLDLLNFEYIVNKLLLTTINVSQGSSTIFIYNIAQILNLSTFFMMLLYTIFSFDVYLIVCCFKALVLWIVIHEGEGFLFYFMAILTNIMTQFGKKFTLNNQIFSTTAVKQIYHQYFDLKKQMQEIYNLFLIIKVIYLICGVGFSIYTTLHVYRETTQFWNWTILGLYGYWMFNSLINVISIIYPFAHFYQTVRVFNYYFKQMLQFLFIR